VRDDVAVFDRVRPLMEFGRNVTARYSAIGGSLVAAGLAFFVFFALAPTALAVAALAGALVTEEQVKNAVQTIIDRSPATLDSLEPAFDAVVKLADRESSGVFTIATVAAIVIATYVASKVVYGLRSTLTRMFGAAERIHGFVDRGLSAVIALVGIVAMVAALLVLQLLPRILTDLGFDTILQLVGTRVVNWTILAVFALVICAIAIRYLPDIRPRVRVRSWGVLFATVWMLVLMLWTYLIFVGILFGAAIEAQRRGVPAPPLPTPIRWPAWLTALTGRAGATDADKNSDGF
jgi:uncharacterized BrkB/YihY/UPF0761 family membrane protein